MAPALRRAKLVDEDPAEAAIADRVRGRPQRIVDAVDDCQDPARRPAVVVREEADVVDAHASARLAAMPGGAEQRRDLGRGAGDGEARGLEGGDLRRGRAGAARDDRAGVAHPLALRRRAAGDEGGLRDVAEVFGGPRGGLLLCRPADLADQDDRVGLRVGGEQLEDVEEASCR